MKSWKKRALALTMAALVVLSGCTFPFGKGNDGDGAPVDNVDVSDAYFGLAWYRSGTTLNPVMDGTEVNSMLREALYEGLFEIKSDFTLENELCEDYTSDGTTFSFTIKKGIKFWSGAELTASDVAESLKTVLENESSPYHNRLTEVSSIEAVTKRMVRITHRTVQAGSERRRMDAGGQRELARRLSRHHSAHYAGQNDARGCGGHQLPHRRCIHHAQRPYCAGRPEYCVHRRGRYRSGEQCYAALYRFELQ